MPLSFSTKAGTLAELRPNLRSARIAPLVRLTVQSWGDDRAGGIAQVEAALGDVPLIVRSSCHREDSARTSCAGAFCTLHDIALSGLADAIDAVIASYHEAAGGDEVLVQPMLSGVVRSGVAFTHDPTTCAPYRMISWSEGSNTAAVTAGLGGHLWQQAAESAPPVEPHIVSVLSLLDELRRLFGDVPMDCEFATTRVDDGGETLWLLQVRPLMLSRAPESTREQAERLQRIHDKVARGMQTHPFLMGRRTVYGVMPDWNPAEILGLRPRPLALSLYRELITDSIWAYQRHNYGYRNLRSFPLMPHFFGLPYIDARLSFNSFIPAELDAGLAGRLVDYYIDRLLAEPALHDKVEFEIVFSCYTFDLHERLERLAGHRFSASERTNIAHKLRDLTNRVLHPQHGLWRKDAAKLDSLQERYATLHRSNLDPLERIYWLIEDGKRYGTLPFAGLARAGFIAIQMLKSLVTVGVLSSADYDSFVGSVSTVSGQLSRDRHTLDRESFLARYGHLRPGTYDILSPRYDEAPDLYFDWTAPRGEPRAAAFFRLDATQLRALDALLQTHRLQCGADDLIEFLRGGIQLREMAKFHFTRNLSDVLRLIAEVGAGCGFTPEDLSYCDIAAFKELHVAAADPPDVLVRSIEQGKARYAESLKLSLPPVISRPEDVWGFRWPDTRPNFITQKQATGAVARCGDNRDLAGAIVCIPNADPGYDWLFAHPISGLVTAWGGANSHMAIRAGELGLPAVIGAGELLYRRWSNARRLRLDCAGCRVEVLS